MNHYQKTLLHLQVEDALADIEAELEKLLAIRDRFSPLVGGDDLERYLIDRAFCGAVQAIHSRIEMLLVEIVNRVDNALLEGQAVINTAAIATPARPAMISDGTRKSLLKMIPMAALASEGNFWPEAILITERCVRALRSEFAAFAQGHQENRQ